MKKTALFLTAVIAAASLCGCGQSNPQESVSVVESPKVPDVVGTEEGIAKTVLASSGFIPTVQTEYDDDVEAGKVIRTSPEAGSTIETNGKVQIFVSKGPRYIECSGATLAYYNVTTGEDD